MLATRKEIEEHALEEIRRISEKPALKMLLPYFRDHIEPEPLPQITGDWYVVQTEPMRETTAFAGLIARRFRAYNPQEPKSIRQNYHKRRIVMRSMVKGYVFASFSLDQPWQRIRSIPGVLRVLTWRDQPVSISVNFLDHLRKLEAKLAKGRARKRHAIDVKNGDWCQIDGNHVMNGFIGQVVDVLANRERITLEVDLLGRQTRVEVSVNQVRVV